MLFFLWVGRISSYFLLLLFGIAFFKFPTLPMKVCSQGYCDKMGNIVTKSVYDSCILWERVALTTLIILVISLIIAWFLDINENLKRKI
jgi:hypothetical protein